ncbi:hypothetical protein [Mangrovibrevibacter kandeliae]|uniref:hypothetical protein n=1 Tax=Mangrovibrevibacter kandeliae TaxID=2968473 RepID=UPI00211893BC|nr:hypothetical protein [Aurantimonas sp. CSK15Z-1]MCQ8781038.1 hypothetical protein [Aurantimonas sp. CSK15Z-1]
MRCPTSRPDDRSLLVLAILAGTLTLAPGVSHAQDPHRGRSAIWSGSHGGDRWQAGHSDGQRRRGTQVGRAGGHATYGISAPHVYDWDEDRGHRHFERRHHRDGGDERYLDVGTGYPSGLGGIAIVGVDPGGVSGGGPGYEPRPQPRALPQMKVIDVSASRIDRRPVAPDGIEIIEAGPAKLIRIGPHYRLTAND